MVVDLVGTLPLTAGRNRWVFVLTDLFTRWQEALAIPDAKAPIMATVLEEQVFCYLGIPEIIYSNQGTQFELTLLESLCAQWGIVTT